MKSLIVFLFSQFVAQETNTFTLTFEKIDNRVEVLVEDSLIYNSGLIEGNPELTFKVDVTKHLVKGLNKLTIRVFNGSEYLPDQDDSHWEIRYEINQNGKLFDYIWDDGDEKVIGKVFEMTHYLEQK